MLLVLDAGNSHIHLGGYEEDERKFIASIVTETGQTADFYACAFRQLFQLHRVSQKWVTGAVIGSVVPAVTAVLTQAIHLLGISDVLEISSGVKTGLNIRTEQPRQVGSDRVAAAVAARAKGKLPCVIADLGTASAFTVLDESGALIGSAILAGVSMSLEALRERAAQLPAVALESGKCALLARNTEDAIRAGTCIGAAAMVDGMFMRFEKALGSKAHLVLTGGSAALVVPHLQVPYEWDKGLCLDGLQLIWKRTRS